ncbi:FAD synthetase 2 chloroplastic [Tripterygium wilfordii]|uniref:FAD synthase n=1 Tax=Tripterygium wilfordii TaxID=458696 RepID=A0A7J7DUP5_TRIWF|nr:FAD synthetase 2, chloroplastic-like [Tripterygium wilfordii]KAF5749856.1 FAD synthetase 2 chloroplastic [Tripterygium wilfordii]
MLADGGSRMSHRLLECSYHPHQYHYLGFGFGLGFCGSKFVQISSSLTVKAPSGAIIGENHHHCRLHQRMVSSSSLQSKSPEDTPILSDCFSQREDDHEVPSEGLSPVAGGVVALGKFDALHIGHRELAIQASKVGVPYLLSLVGMAEVLGWEPRAPVVAKCDRKRVLSSWAPYCVNNVAPDEFRIEFSSVRHLTPRQFVEKLSKELEVCGVVAGENYRFGYKAAGDASELVRLCEEYGMDAYIINSVMDKNQDLRSMNLSDLKERGQVSSTRVRHALDSGDMKYVSELLGRPHRILLAANDHYGFRTYNERSVLVSKCCLLNLPPKDGFYEDCSLLLGDEKSVPCRLCIYETHIHLEAGEEDILDHYNIQDFRSLGIEFGYES